MPKLLLIDDDEELCSELAEAFRAAGYTVDNTSDSVEGSILIKKNIYDVALFDYKMKGLTGIDLLKMLKGINPACAAFLVSGRTGLDALIKDEHVGELVNGVISKPFNVEALLKKVRSAVK